MSERTENGGWKFTGYHMLAVMLVFFGVIVAVNLTAATLASSTWTGLVVKNSYVASQKFNDELDGAAAQRERGWQSTLTYTSGTLTVSLVDASGLPLKPSTIEISLGRPAFEQQDRVLVLPYTGGEIFSTEHVLEPGLWAIQVNAVVDGTPYRRDARVHVNSSGIGKIE
ncbi:MAG: FixH family protein [Rhizobiaceae bacterium]